MPASFVLSGVPSAALKLLCSAALLLSAAPRQGAPQPQTAEQLGRQEAAQRADEAARQPQVAPGLKLPDESGVWGLDRYRDEPELVRVAQSDGDLNLAMGHTVHAASIPQGGAREAIWLDGSGSKIVFHTLRPVFYIALDVAQEPPAREDAMTVNTAGAGRGTRDRDETASPQSGYAVARLHVAGHERVAMAAELQALGQGGSDDASDRVIAVRTEVLPGGHWMRATPAVDLEPGQYSLVELLARTRWNTDGWDFGVVPSAGENRGARLPLRPGP